MTRVIGPPKSRRRKWTFLCALLVAMSVGVLYIAGAGAWNSTTDGVENTGFFELDGNTSQTTALGTLNAAIANGTATSISVNETGTAPAVPFIIKIDSEQLNVTARTGAANPRTYTVTRGYNGTVGAAHSNGAGVSLISPNSSTACLANAPNDWTALAGTGGAHPCGADGFSFVRDGVGSADSTYWNGGGSKDAYDPALGPWQWAPNDVSPDKNDLDNAFAAIYHLNDQAAGATNPTTFLFFGSDRFNTNGDAQQGFQFLQSNTCLAGAPASTPGNAACPPSTPTTPSNCTPAFTGSNSGSFVDPTTGCPVHHRDGDLLVLVNFNNGGTLGSAGVFKWGPASGSGTPGAIDSGGQYNQVQFGSGTNAADCTTISGVSFFCSTSNKVNLAEPVLPASTWPYSAKGVTGQATYSASSFIEGGVDLTAIGGAGTCFPSFVAESRSSAGPGTGLGLTAQLKDLVFGKFELCGASISIAPDAVNEVGATHTFTVTVNGTSTGQSGPIAGVHPTVTLTGSSGISGTYSGTGTLPGDFGDIHVISDSCANGTGTDANGQCAVQFTSSKAGIVRGHASATLTLGGQQFPVATDPNASSANGGDAIKRFVDAKISLSPLTATNKVRDNHTITATVQQNDGLAAGSPGDGSTGFGPAPDGTLVTFTLLNDTGNTSFVNGNTCTTSGGTGTCTVQITSDKAGSVTIHATTTFSVGGVSLTRATGDGKAGDGTNVNKTFVDAQIQIGPALANNTVNQAHTDTITVKQDDGLPANATGGDAVTGFGPPPTGTTVTVTLTGSAGITGTYPGTGTLPQDFGDIHVVSNSCASAGTTSAGTCTIVFTSAKAGTVTAHASVTFSIGGVSVTRQTDGVSPNSGDAVKNFVAGSLVWHKVDNAGNPLGGATFQVCKTKDYDFTTQSLVTITASCSSVTDNDSSDADNTVGNFKLAGLSLGEYTIEETTAPAGFLIGTAKQTVDLLPATPNGSAANNFVNLRPILKITGFSYTNAALDASPTTGITHGTVTYTVNLHNYAPAGGTAVLSNSSLVVSNNATCTGGNTQAITGTINGGANLTPFTMTCTYNIATPPAAITATLTVKYTTNGTERNASGSPATITFTVQGD